MTLATLIIMSEQSHIYGEGYIPDKPDSRDKIFHQTLFKEIATTGIHTQAGFLEVKPIPSYNQQDIGSKDNRSPSLLIRNLRDTLFYLMYFQRIQMELLYFPASRDMFK